MNKSLKSYKPALIKMSLPPAQVSPSKLVKSLIAFRLYCPATNAMHLSLIVIVERFHSPTRILNDLLISSISASIAVSVAVRSLRTLNVTDKRDVLLSVIYLLCLCL